MTASPLPLFADDMLQATFAANPGYELVLFDRLPAAERETLAALRDDPELYGILRPRDPRSGLSIKVVDRETALLFLSLTPPGQLPAYLGALLGDGVRDVVARLVYDSVLGIEAAGELRFGGAAHAVLGEDGPAAPGDGLPARLSHAALRYAAALMRLGTDDAATLSSRLYTYNRLPVAARWRRAFPSPQGIARALGFDAGGACAATLGQRWHRSETARWVSWSALAPPAAGPGGTLKLYVSPGVEHLADAFRVVTESLTATATISFKVGRDLSGVLRPDKLVVYCACRDAIDQTAERLRRRLEGMPAQGVPFTAAIDEDGLLSCGVDPPRRERSVPWRGSSWRHWLTDRLAAALIAARTAGTDAVEPCQFALERLRLEGIDPFTWAPADGLFN